MPPENLIENFAYYYASILIEEPSHPTKFNHLDVSDFVLGEDGVYQTVR